MIVFLVLLIGCVGIFFYLKKVLVIAKVYEDVQAAYIAIFVVFRKRKEHLFGTYENDLDLMAFYESLNELSLDKRINEELDLAIIDDDCLLYKEEALEKIEVYNKLLQKYDLLAKKEPMLVKLLAHDFLKEIII